MLAGKVSVRGLLRHTLSTKTSNKEVLTSKHKQCARRINRLFSTTTQYTKPKEQSLTRQLGRLEVTVGSMIYHFGGAYNLVRAISLARPLNQEILEDAIDDMRIRHPTLQKRAMTAILVGGAFRETEADVPVHFVPRESESTWEEVMEQQLNKNMKETTIEVHVVQDEQSPDYCELILTVSHLAADGPSINALVDELLQRYTVLEKVKAKGLKTIDAPAVEVMPQLAAIEQNYPWIERGPPGLMKSMPFMWKRESTLVKAKPIGLPFEEMLQMANITPASSLSPKLEKGPLSRIVHFDFETQPYTKASAEHNIEPTSSVLAAAVLAAKSVIFELGEDQEMKALVQSSFNLRNFFNPPISESNLLVMSATMPWIVSADPGRTFWDIASMIEKQTISAIHERLPMVLTNYLFATNALMSAAPRTQPIASIVDLGELPLDRDVAGHMKVHAMTAAQSNRLPLLQIVMGSYGGITRGTISFPEYPKLTRDHVERVVEHMKETLSKL